MRSPTDEGPWLIRDEVSSTQDVAAEFLNQSEQEVPGIVFAYDQKRGRGRFRREWDSQPEQSLTASFIYPSYADHKEPWLIGMSVGLAVAIAVDGLIQWPNDVVINGKKVAGILTELIPSDKFGKVPVIGVGVNLGQEEFADDLTDKATSLLLETGRQPDALELVKVIIGRIIDIPEPQNWQAIEPVWTAFDDTPGKRYNLPTGEEVEAVRVGSSGELVYLHKGAEKSVMAAEAIFGS